MTVMMIPAATSPWLPYEGCGKGAVGVWPLECLCKGQNMAFSYAFFSPLLIALLSDGEYRRGRDLAQLWEIVLFWRTLSVRTTVQYLSVFLAKHLIGLDAMEKIKNYESLVSFIQRNSAISIITFFARICIKFK